MVIIQYLNVRIVTITGYGMKVPGKVVRKTLKEVIYKIEILDKEEKWKKNSI